MEPTHFESIYPENSRFREIQSVIGLIKQGKSCQIIGIPGVGKSNLLKLLTFNRNIRIKHLGENQKWYHFVEIDFSLVENKPLYDVLKLIFFNILESVENRGLKEEAKEIDQIFRKSVEKEDEFILFEGLKKTITILSVEKQLTLVLLMDRFEEYMPTITKTFFTNLRILRDEAKYRFSVVLSLTKPIENNLESTTIGSFYEFLAGNLIYLSVMDKPSLDFRINYLERSLSKKINKDLLGKIIDLTSGHGKLTRLCIETILSNPTPAHPDLQNFLLNNKTIVQSLKQIWQSCSFAEQKILISISQKNIQDDAEITSELQNTGLINKDKITIPIFEEYIKQNDKEFQKESDHIILEGDDIKKNGLSLTDKLTYSEFKLLKFMLQNPQKIINREEIINNVWKNLKSTQGVTDQAIDQIIFRLRRKIEDQPGESVHLQTIKGRGIKFTP